MKATQLREKTAEELQEAYDETRQALFDLQVRVDTGDGTEQPLKARVLRREVARIKTVMRELEREGVENHG
ncbi:MAG: 50S ribosomal protein L29 [Verrucomicrobia bacterium]|nr:50S ribosomal protein L29 [Verrucomicrobiota bacterium]